MPDGTNNLSLIEAKENRYKILLAKYTALYEELNTVRNRSDEISIKLEIKQIEAEIEELQAEIKRLRALETGSDRLYGNYCNNWEDKIPKIDFSKANGIVDHIFKKIKNEEGAALFLLQNSRSMGGYLYVKNIESYLQDIGNLYSIGRLEFLSNQQADQIKFLNFLAQKFAVESYVGDIHHLTDDLIEKIIEKICNSLCSGNILFMEVDIYYLNPQNQFLNWFLNEFWCRLVRQLPELSRKHPLVRFIAVLTIGSSLPKDCLTSVLCCKKQSFDQEKFLKLPLQQWKQEEIENWLFNFSGLTSPKIGYSCEQIKEMAFNIYQNTQGNPREVYHELMDQMSKLVSDKIRN